VILCRWRWARQRLAVVRVERAGEGREGSAGFSGATGVTGRYAVALSQLGPGLGHHITVRSGSRTAGTDLYVAAGQATTFLAVLDGPSTRSG